MGLTALGNREMVTFRLFSLHPCQKCQCVSLPPLAVRVRWQVFELKGSKPLEEYLEARALGIQTRPVLLGPVSFLLLSKPARGQDALSFRPLSLLPGLLAVYQKLLQQLAEGGAEWVQIDEPVLCLDHDAEVGHSPFLHTQS